LIISTLILTNACNQEKNSVEEKEIEPKKELSFQSRMISDSAQHWWAHCPVEVTGDGITDLVFIHNNSSGGYLAYYAGQKDTGLWELNIIAEKPPKEGFLFAAGDLECEDMDGDGDVDILAIQHPGEWINAGEEAMTYWYENPSWEVHEIGKVPDAVKDVSFADFNLDQKMDLAVLTFESNTLSIFEQKDKDNFERVRYYENYNNLHEGMATGDINGDGYPDIVANAWVFYNPKKDLTTEWKMENINEKWNNQTGDWSRNGTKAFARDLNGDGKDEIFISHSERAGYPLAWYQRNAQNEWEEHIISDSIAACHTLQVYDFDQDGDYDVLAGVNWARAVNLGKEESDVMIFLSSDHYQSWTPMLIEKEGIYNGQVADYDGDGDFDIFRYPNHEAKEYYLLENQLVQK